MGSIKQLANQYKVSGRSIKLGKNRLTNQSVHAGFRGNKLHRLAKKAGK